MKFAIENDQKRFFRKNRFLETEGLLSETELNELNLHIDKALIERLKIKEDKLHRQFSQDVLKEGRDLSRFDDYLKKTVLHQRFAEIASELIEFRPLRFGYDQLYINNKESGDWNPYKSLILEPSNLKDISSLQGVLCGALLCLKNKDESNGESDIFSKKVGNITFFSAELPLNFNDLQATSEKRYLMIVYTQPTAIYYLQEKDPKTHHLKSLGYVFGDRLNDKLNPIVYR